MTTDKSKRLFQVTAEDFKKIPGSPIIYWFGVQLRKIFVENPAIGSVVTSRCGMNTGDNDFYLRLWFEVGVLDIGFEYSSCKTFLESDFLYAPYNKGGTFRKWFGNLDYVIKFDKYNYTNLSCQGNHLPSKDFYFCECITWSDVTSAHNGVCFRFMPQGSVFDGAAAVCFPSKDKCHEILCYLNTKFTRKLASFLNPTLHFKLNDFAKLPLPKLGSFYDSQAKRCIFIEKTDWDSYETSWDFQNNPLIDAQKRCEKIGKIHSAYLQLREEWRRSCEEMRRLEVENNRIFIEAYGLQDELSPEVPWDEITLTCNPWYRYGKSPKTVCRDGEELLESTSDMPVSDNWGIEHGGRIIVMPPVVRMKSRSMPFNQDLENRLLSDTIKEFISYAVGCMMGRYSPEKPGLILADQGSTLDDYLNIMGNRDAKLASGASYSETTTSLVSEPYSINECCGFQYHQIIDYDGVLPILDEEWFADDIVTQFRNFVSFTFGAENLTANLGFIENVLGKDIRKYFVKDFYKDHVQRYKKRPIYWLFSSPKGSFNALIYLHRYTPDTVSIVLNEYLREMMTKIRSRIEHLVRENNRADIGNAEKTRNMKKIDKYTAQLTELEDYERDILFPLAQQKIAIDLDDGVKVNYLKFGPALKKIPKLEAKEE